LLPEHCRCIAACPTGLLYCFDPADADYNDDEDIALWQNQRSVTHVTIRGTFHAGGFFAPGHLARARAAMPRLRCVLFANCGDLHSDRLQQVVDARLAPLVVMQACGAESTAAGKIAAAAAAGLPDLGAADVIAPGVNAADVGAGGVAAAAGSAGAGDDVWLVVADAEGAAAQMDAVAHGDAGSSSSSSSGSDADGGVQQMDYESAGVAANTAAAGGGVAADVAAAPQLVSEAVVKRMSAGAAAAGVTLQWVSAVQPWRACLDDEAAWQ
jgi:hypothetical protein